MENGRKALRTALGLDWHGTMRGSDLQPLVHALARIVVEGTPRVGSYVIVEVGDAFVQFCGAQSDTELWCEAVSNYYLNADQRLEPQQIARLHELGFASPTRAPWEPRAKGTCPNYGRQIDVGTETRLFEAALMAVEILHHVYGVPQGSEMQIKLCMEVWPATPSDTDADAAA